MKNKKSICIALLLLASETIVSAFGGRAPETVTGHIKYYGNAPFEFPGIETADGYLYTLQVEENAPFTIEDIEKEQGFALQFTGTIDKSQGNGLNVLKDGIFIVSEWKKLQ